MPIEYQIDGSITLRDCPESEEIIDDLRLFFEIDAAVQTKTTAEGISLTVNATSDSSYIAQKMPGLIERMKLLGLGAGFFDCESEGERWVEYVGNREECARLESAEALLDISALLPRLTASDREALIELNQLNADLAKARETAKARALITKSYPHLV